MNWTPSTKVMAIGSLLVAVTATVALLVSEDLVPLGTALVGAGAGVGGAYSAGHWQWKRTRLELSLRNRATAYIKLSEFLVRLRVAANTAASGISDLDELADTLSTEDWFSLQAYVEAFGSPEVRSAFKELLVLRVRLRTALHDWNETRQLPPGSRPPSTPYLEQLNDHRTQVLDNCKGLLERINNELGHKAAS